MTTQRVSCVPNYWTWEKKQNVSGVLLDLRKTFVCLNWRGLLQELWKVGIRENAYTWMESYLTDRAQFVEIRTAIGKEKPTVRSELRHMTNGVPHGSVLVPLLFLVFINGLPQQTPPTTKCIMFADDTTLLVSARTKEELEPRIQNSVIATVQRHH